MAYSLSWRQQLEAHEQFVARGLVGQMLRDLMTLGGNSESTMHHAGQKLASNSRAETLAQALSTFTSMGLGGNPAGNGQGARALDVCRPRFDGSQ